MLKKPGRKPSNAHESLRSEVLWVKRKLKYSATGIAAYLRRNRGVRVDNNLVHKILLEEGLAVEEPNKKGRRRWVRYEREHALSAVHMDWFYHNGNWVIAVLDDCSRMVLAARECDRRSVEASIAVLNEAYERYKHLRPIREVITEHELSSTPIRGIRREELSIALRSSAKLRESSMCCANTITCGATAKLKSGYILTSGSERSSQA